MPETGKVLSISTSTTGTIDRDSNTAPDPINFNDSSLITRGIALQLGDLVNFDVVDLGRGNFEAENIQLIAPAEPAPPAPLGEKKTADINGDLIINGNTVTLMGITVTGNISMNGGVLIIRTSDTNSARSKVIGSMDGKDNNRVVIYKSDVGGSIDFKNGAMLDVYDGNLKNVDFKNSQEAAFKKSTIGSMDGKDNMRVTLADSTINGNIDVKSNTDSVTISNVKVIGSMDGKNNKKITIDRTSTQGDITLKGNAFASVSNSNITGDLRFIENTDCCQKNNVVSGTNSGCTKVCP